jgi:hypothetical protein
MFICVVCVEKDMKIHVGPMGNGPSHKKKADEMGENEGIRKGKGELSAANLSQRDEEGGGNGSQP